ncbi:hypothetical protein [Streptomyces sp. NPDC005407]|uniref:hypothetical protein n=1 Tax=Streptomyces sp. NPDC005407 TaxID=3155340 RepID=UPI0033B21971
MDTTTSAPDKASPWDRPPQRAKTLRTKAAEKKARRAEFWGRRIQDAQQDGPQAVAVVAWDRVRGSLARLPEAARDRGFEALAEAADRIREQYAQ